MLLLPQIALAWSGNIHRAVCEIVWQSLDQSERQQLYKITKSHEIQNFSAGCAWPDWIRKKPLYQHTAGWHYQNFDQPENPLGSCTQGCLLNAIRHNYTTARTAVGRKRAESLYFLAHLIADLHQPLHAGRASDKGGNLLMVQYQGRKINLHKIWDGRMLARKKEQIILDIQKFDQSVPETLLWPASVEKWYAESRHIAVERIYPAYESQRIIHARYVAEFRPLSYQLLNRSVKRITQVVRSLLGKFSE